MMNQEILKSSVPSSTRDPRFDPLQSYGALGDGRTVALTGASGSVDWWCVPHLDSAPLFDRLLNPEEGGYFSLRPTTPYEIQRRYISNTNVLETIFTTESGQARVLESLNSGPAGRLPWSELARRIECLRGKIHFEIQLAFSRRANTINPYKSSVGEYQVFRAELAMAVFIHSDNVRFTKCEDSGIIASVKLNEN